MPCYGPEGFPKVSDEEILKRETKKYVEYIQNTEFLLTFVLDILKLNLTGSNSENHCDYITSELCNILRNLTPEQIKILNNSKYALQIGVWWEDHKKLDDSRK